MAEPVRNPETGGRSLADILREAGIENPTRTGRRRRWDDMDDTGIRQRRADAEREDPSAGAPYGRRAGDLALDRPEVDRSSGMARVRDERFRRPQPSDARGQDERRGREDRRADDRVRPDRAARERTGEDHPRQPRPQRPRPDGAAEAAREAPRDAVR